MDKTPVCLQSLIFGVGEYTYCLRSVVLFHGDNARGHYTCVKYVQCQGENLYVHVNDGKAQKLCSSLMFLQSNAQGICALLFDRRDTASLLTQPELADDAQATPKRAADAKRKLRARAAEATPEQLQRKQQLQSGTQTPVLPNQHQSS